MDVLRTHAELFEPTQKEREVLKNHEQFIDFKILPPFGISEGRQSRVSLLEYSANDKKERVIWKRMGAGKGLTHEEAQTLDGRLHSYRDTLTKYGWNVPNLFFHKVIDLESESQIFSYEKAIEGGDANIMVRNRKEPNFKKWHLLKSVLDTLSSQPSPDLKRIELLGKEVSALPYGIDLKLANVVLDREGKMFFVDLFCPKELDKNGNWATYLPKLDNLPEQNLKAVTATREGALLRMYRLAESEWASTGMTTEAIRNGFMEIMDAAPLFSDEKRLIMKEIEEGFPWLDAIYNERGV